MVPAQKKKTSAASLDPEGLNVEVGDQVLVAGQKHGVVRFFGKTDFAPGEFARGDWFDWDAPTQTGSGGSDDGSDGFNGGSDAVLMVLMVLLVLLVLMVLFSPQVTGSVSSWISRLGSTTALCSACVTSAACPNMACLPRPPACRGASAARRLVRPPPRR